MEGDQQIGSNCHDPGKLSAGFGITAHGCIGSPELVDGILQHAVDLLPGIPATQEFLLHLFRHDFRDLTVVFHHQEFFGKPLSVYLLKYQGAWTAPAGKQGAVSTHVPIPACGCCEINIPVAPILFLPENIIADGAELTHVL